ncbi:hypothetical protein B5V89_12630, partial [Heyndrickxia sporothermodurans]
MSKQVAEVFQYHYQKRSKKRNLTVRVITVIHYIRLCKLFCVNDFVTIFLTILKYMFLPARGIGQCWGATRAPSRVLHKRRWGFPIFFS